MVPPISLAQNPIFIEISRNVRSWELNPLAVTLIAATCGGVLITVAGYVIYNRYFRPEVTAGDALAIKERGEILDILNTALNKRAKIEFSFEPIEEPHRAAACSLIEISDQGLTIELPDYLEPRPDWKDRPVYFFFGLESENKARIFYTFHVNIANFHRDAQGRLHINVLLPHRLELRQKRRHLRLEPPSHLIRRLVVWKAVYAKGYAMEENVAKWGKPLFVIIPGKGDQALLMDISAGGIRLKIMQPIRRAKEFDPEKNRNFFLCLDINDPETGRPRRFWFSGSLRNYYEDFTSRDLEIGLNFVGLGKPDPEQPNTIIWQKIDTEIGVVDLENWIVKRYMELYRKKGLA